ncbi:hypothetical protein O0Q50_19725 [Priestia aryabhattai]|uniref:Uncharacterized protein n=1 Tax=Priestia aryabhattai TaxID=412384 RepID=A0AAX6NCE5_PRIAR|nr:hypothetical protein [Priestia aryabhattai]MDU9693406.1 hypothetical protein [Priestia aryabhattai]
MKIQENGVSVGSKGNSENKVVTQPLISMEELRVGLRYELNNNHDIKPEFHNVLFQLVGINAKDNTLDAVILEGKYEGLECSPFRSQIKKSSTVRTLRSYKKERVYGLVNKVLTLGDFEPYKLEGFLNSFEDESLEKYKGMPFEIIRSLTSDEVHIVSAPMFKIQFKDGFLTNAYMDEIFASKIFDKLIKDENLVRD